MTLKELKELIDEEVASAMPISTDEGSVLREPQIPVKPRPVYRPVLKTEDEIDLNLFHGGKKID